MEVEAFFIDDELALLKFPLLILFPAALEDVVGEIFEDLVVELEVLEEAGVFEGLAAGLKLPEEIEVLEALDEEVEALEGLVEELEALEALDEEEEVLEALDEPPFG
ncbi:hypothetical protein I6U48_19490 [Clostridium sp. PL3]|uniref:Uncharacterized protein n=1 Tax=Clostridium thailandense TaxID=2794346 RepID=A0A949X555_9CLOT|nr:hypothetical protein [Clostridium thailandense]MBV7275088.1 hypothetical protein [Clostridium thailandense]